MPEFTPASWVTAWTWSWPGIAVAFVLAVPYVVLVSRARRLGHHWPIWRTAVYLVAGVGSLIYVTCGAIGSYRTTFLWCFGAEVGVIATITPSRWRSEIQWGWRSCSGRAVHAFCRAASRGC